MNQSSLLAEFGDPITRVENALIALKEGRTIINRMLMTKERQWTPHRIEVRTASGRCKGHRSRNK